MTDHTQLELQRLETQLDTLQRRHDQCFDILRSLQYLVDAIHISQNGAPLTPGTILEEAYENARAALRTSYNPNGEHQ